MDSSNLMTLTRMPAASQADVKSDRSSGIKDRNAGGSDASFQDVLRGISRNDKKEGREKEPAVLKDIKNKMDEIEKSSALSKQRKNYRKTRIQRK